MAWNLLCPFQKVGVKVLTVFYISEVKKEG